jgi:hypothetical protein
MRWQVRIVAAFPSALPWIRVSAASLDLTPGSTAVATVELPCLDDRIRRSISCVGHEGNRLEALGPRFADSLTFDILVDRLCAHEQKRHS